MQNAFSQVLSVVSPARHDRTGYHPWARNNFAALFLAAAMLFVAAPLFGQSGPAFKNPPNIYYTGGTLDLNTAPALIDWAGEKIRSNVYSAKYQGRSYDPSYAPPTIRIANTAVTRTLELHLSNNMGTLDCITPSHDYTNLHYHGFEVSPVAPSDDVITIKIPRGKSYPYRVPFPNVPGKQHPEGMFWYHPHPHGCSFAQVNQGMSGALIVGDLLKSRYPAYAGIPEQILLLKDGKPTPTGLQQEENNILALAANPNATVAPPRITVNSLNQPTITMQPGIPQFFRIGNVGSNAYVNLAMPNVRAFIIAVDGMATARPILLDSANGFILPPGSRVEMIVFTPSQPAELLSLPLPAARAPDREVLARIAVATGKKQQGAYQGGSEADLQKATLPASNYYPTAEEFSLPNASLQCQILTPSPDPRYTFVFTQDAGKFMMNGKQYEEGRLDVTCPIPSHPTWTIFNNTTQHHTFHIHQIHFRVDKINGRPVGEDEAPIRDNVDVPPQAVVEMTMPFDETYLAGEFVLHCHILAHEDRGMMMNISLHLLKSENDISKPGEARGLKQAQKSR